MKVMEKNIRFNIICFATFFFIQGATAKTGYFWHLTDIHFDKNYTVDGDPTQMCWLTGKNTSRSLAEIGDHDCDASKALVDSAINAMKSIYPKPDFILWTGDDTTHVNDSFFNTDKVVGIISNLTSTIKKAFPDSLVLPVLGNHDLFPQNEAPIGRNELQTKVANLWKDWLDKSDAYTDFKSDGRYVADIPDSKLSVVALNTLLWYNRNSLTANDPDATDPSGQFAWLDDTIQEIIKKGRKVYLMGHIPPGLFERYFEEEEGFHWYQERYNKKYINVIRKHWKNIPAQFFGHNHFDSFRIFSDDDDKPIAYMLIAPQVSPMKSDLSVATGANNPGIRLIAYDTETGEIEEVSQYYMDLEKAILEGKEKWQLEYNMTDILNISTISASSLSRAAQRMEEDRSFFDSFYPANTVQWENATACSDHCRHTFLCAFTNVDYADFYECNITGASTRLTSLVTLTLIMGLTLHFVYRWRM